jgi:hypothetical protein
MEYFERHESVVLKVACKKDRRHATAPKLALQVITVGKKGLKPGEEV